MRRLRRSRSPTSNVINRSHPRGDHEGADAQNDTVKRRLAASASVREIRQASAVSATASPRLRIPRRSALWRNGITAKAGYRRCLWSREASRARSAIVQRRTPTRFRGAGDTVDDVSKTHSSAATDTLRGFTTLYESFAKSISLHEIEATTSSGRSSDRKPPYNNRDDGSKNGRWDQGSRSQEKIADWRVKYRPHVTELDDDATKDQ